LTAIAVLAAGIALATTSFAVVDGVLFKPLPFPRAHELFLVRPDAASDPKVQPPPASGWDLTAWREAAPEIAMAAMSAPSIWMRVDGRDYGQIEVDSRFFDVIGRGPLLGGFTSNDYDFAWPETPGTTGVWQPKVISHRLWQREYGGDPGVIGRRITVRVSGGREIGYRIVGVLPPDFVFPIDVGDIQPDLVTPVRTREMERSPERRYHVIARVAPGEIAAVRGRLLAATRALSGTVPFRNPDLLEHGGFAPRATFDQLQLVPLADHLGRRQRAAFAIILAATGLLLLLASVSVAGLAAARSVDRRRELAVRRALGATGWTLARGVLAEIGLLAVAAIGVALAAVGPLLTATLALLPPALALFKTPAVDLRVFVAAALLGMIAVALASLWPVQVALRLGVSHAEDRGGSPVTRSSRRSNLVLVAAEVTLGFVLLTSGALTVTSLSRVWAGESGFDRNRVVLLEAFLKSHASGADDSAALRNLIDTLRLVPGVDDVSATNIRMFGPLTQPSSEVVPRGAASVDGVASRNVDASFFRVTALRLVDGYLPDASEWQRGAPVAVVSETAARLMWPGTSPLGQILTTTRPQRDEPVLARRVVGVVVDARYQAADRDPVGDIYLPGPIGPGSYGGSFLVRSTAPAGPLVASLKAAAEARGFRVDRATALADALFLTVRSRALTAWLFGLMGAIGLAILGAGILGLVAMATAQRTREIGIRCALGATAPRVLRELVREQVGAVGVGLLAGAVISAWAVRGIESQLYSVRVYDPAVWTEVALTVILVALVATGIPAWRSAHIDTVFALKAD
jgi:predicted permease